MINLAVNISAGNPNEGDIGQVLTGTLTQIENPFDLTGASSITINMIDPAGNMLTRNGTISATPSTGLFTYSFIDGDIPLSGKYSVQCIISMSTGNQYSTTIAYFRAGGVLASKNPPGVAFIALQPLLSCVVSQSLTLQTGVITLTAASGMSLAKGQFMNVIYEGNNTQWMEGTVLGYNAQTGFLSIAVINFAGSGTYSDWLVCISSAYSAGSTNDARNAEIYKNQAFDYMTTAAGSASAAGLSELAAASSASTASSSSTAAGLSETAAANSASAAGLSETAAANSASAAGLSETAAANSASAAGLSETAAANSASAAGLSETAAANSASTAATYSRVRLNSTAYVVGTVVITPTIPVDLVLYCSTAGTSASSEPAGMSTLTEGATISDGTVEWTAAREVTSNQTLSSGINLWNKNSSVVVGQIAYSASLPSWAHLECTTAGTTATTEPTWGTTVDVLITDNTAVWKVTAFAPLTSPAFRDTPTTPTPAQFDASTQIANGASVMSAIGAVRGILAIAANHTLVLADNGKVIVPSTSGISIGTPATPFANAHFIIMNNSSGTINLVATTGASILYGEFGWGLSTISIPALSMIELYSDGISWITKSLSRSTPYSMGSTGFRTIDAVTGLTLQWGVLTNVAAGSTVVSFPTTFKNVCVFARAVGSNANGSTNNADLVTSLLPGSFTFYMNYGVTISYVWWFALGY